MKFLVAFALIAAVASAGYIRPTAVSGELAQIQEVIAAIQSPSTDPATAAALEAMLQDLIGVQPEPVIIGPAIVDTVEPVIVVDQPSPIIIGPAIVDTIDPISVVDGPVAVSPVVPIPDGGAVTAVEPIVSPAPVAVGPAVTAETSPLVQIIVNVNQAAAGAVPAPVESPIIAPEPVIVVDEAQNVDPVIVVDTPAIVEPVQVVDTPTVVEPVQVVDSVEVEPVQVAEPIIVEPVIVGVPIIPAPAIVLPDELN